MNILLKAGLLLGLIGFVGAGFFGRYFVPGLAGSAAARRLQVAQLLLAAVVVSASVGLLVQALVDLLGYVDVPLLTEFLLQTRQGVATLIRTGLALVLVVLGATPRLGPRFDRPVHLLASLGVLASVSWVSHTGVESFVDFLSDLIHLLAASVWGGALVFLAWLPLWRGEPSTLQVTVRRLSTVGIVSVLVLGMTGLLASLLHTYGPGALVSTGYGRALALKLLLVLAIVAVAAVNRRLVVPPLTGEKPTRAGAFDVLPGSLKPPDAAGARFLLRRLVSLEGLLLAAVLATTGLLTTLEPAHSALPGEEHLDHAAFPDLEAELPVRAWLGEDLPGDDASLLVEVRDGTEPVAGATVVVLRNSADDDPDPAPQTARDLGAGRYLVSPIQTPESGNWLLFGGWVLSIEVTYPDGEVLVETVDVRAEPPPPP